MNILHMNIDNIFVNSSVVPQSKQAKHFPQFPELTVTGSVCV